MKKFLSVFAMVLALLMLCTVALADDAGLSVDGTDADSTFAGIPYEDATRVHEVDGHDVSFDKIVKEPTCTERGIARYTCESEDDHFHEVYIAALGHDWDDGEVTKEPTCTETGVLTITCNRCGATKTETIEALGHLWSHDVDGENWGRVTVKPTCMTHGEAEDFCVRCGEVNDDILPRIIEPLEHSFTKEVIDAEPNCMEDGKKHFECEYGCGTVKTDENGEVVYEAIPLPEDAVDGGHDWDNWLVLKQATCAEEGNMVRWCKRCGDKQEKTLEKLEEDYVVIKTTEKTRLVDCYTMEITTIKTYECQNCGGKDFGEKLGGIIHPTYDGEPDKKTVDVVSHVFKFEEEYIKEQKEATCEEDGYIIYQCIFFDENDKHEDDEDAIYTVVLPAHGHEWNSWEMRYAPGQGANEYGYWLRDCKICGKTEERITRYAAEECVDGEHDYKIDETIPATCSTEGSITYICNICGKVYSETIAKLPHTWEEVSTVAPTCTEAGVINYVCTVCGETKTEEGEPATGHTIVEDPAVAPTTTSTGKTAGTHCSVCGEIIVAQEEIPALIANEYVIDLTDTDKGEDGSNGDGAITVTGTEELPTLYARVTWVYTLSEGDSLAFCAMKPVTADGNTLTFDMTGPVAPFGAVLDEIQVALVTNANANKSGSYDALALTKK